MLKMGAASSAELGDRWRQRSQETHKQSSHTTNIARFELFFDTLPPHPCVYSNVYSTLRNPSSDSGVYRS